MSGRKVDIRYYVTNSHGRQEIASLEELQHVLTGPSPYWRTNPPHRIVKETIEVTTVLLLTKDPA